MSKEYLTIHTNDWYNANQMLKKECPKYRITYTDTSKNREDIIRTLRNDMISKDLFEEYHYTKFSPENIHENYDVESVLSAEDI